ncbi:hypothetical protein [Novosphingobium sp.]|uniref:hypothetical protein n=1 Tax=Novosphingobium sp. TaxID=1874826 RepID=UPI0025FBAAEA|nr:hypothetical protein [Novosphingobium sp.]MCC6925298.1 hypothetical protein [Novosphingobium sp.]
MAILTSQLNEIIGALTTLNNQVQNQFPDGASFSEHFSWQNPGISKQDFSDRIARTIEHLSSSINVDVSDQSIVDRFSRIPATVNFLSGNTLPNSNGGNAYFAYIAIFPMLDAIDALLEKIDPTQPNWEEIQEKSLVPASIKKRLDTVDRGVRNIEKQFGEVGGKIRLIDEAHQAANALPASLSGLDDARAKFENATRLIANLSKQAEDSDKKISEYVERIERNLVTSHELTSSIDGIQRAAIRQGLGRSFAKRSNVLSISTYILMALLAISLFTAANISHSRIQFIEKLLSNPRLDHQILWANVALTALSVAAPVWFAWLLTRQIGQRFRLSEDYGFKASVAEAYEGYRRESQEVGDEELQKRLLGIALDRVEEAPLSHIEKEESSSPLHDLVSRFRVPPKPQAEE